MARSLISQRLVNAESVAEALLGHSVTVATGVPQEEAERIKQCFRAAGASCKAVPSDPRRAHRGVPSPRKRGPDAQKRSRPIPVALVAAVVFGIFVAALVLLGRNRPRPATPPEAQAPPVPGPERVLAIKPGDRKAFVLRTDLPLVLSDSSPLSARTVIGIRQNEWQKAGVIVDIVSQAIETSSVPVWLLREGSGQRWIPGVTALTPPTNLPRGFNPALFREIGVARAIPELVKLGSLPEQEFRSRVKEAGRSGTAVEQGRVRIQQMKVTLAVQVPFSKTFEGGETGTGLVSIGTQKFLLDTGSAGTSVPVDCWVQLPFVQTKGEAGLSLVRAPDAPWKVLLP